MKYPSLSDVESACRAQLCRWWKYLPHPKSDEQTGIFNSMCRRFREGGDMTIEEDNLVTMGVRNV